MRQEKKTEALPIEIMSSSGDAHKGMLTILRWNKIERPKRALKISGKILGCVLALCCAAVFVHPLILPSITLLSLTILGSPIYFSYFLGQKATFIHAQGQCPSCKAEGQLNRYLWATVSHQVTLICPACGQTCRAILVETPVS